MRYTTRTRNLLIGTSLLAVLIALGLASVALEKTAAAQSKSAVQAPRFEVDPLWPKPLPNHWVLGSSIGVWVDSDDHIWMIHRSSATLGNNEKPLELGQGECCAGAPPVLEFDQAGLLVRVVRWNRTMIGTVPTQTDYGDYRDVAGVKMPFQIVVTWTNGQNTITLTDVRPNVAVDAARFGRPAPFGSQ